MLSNYWIRVFAVISILSLSAPLQAQLGEYERNKLTGALQAPALIENPAIFDGAAFNPDADLDTAYSYMNAYTRAVNTAVAAVNAMSGPGRRSDEGKALVIQVRDKLRYSKAMTSTFRAFEQQKKSMATAGTITDKPSDSQTSAQQQAGGNDGLSDDERNSMRVHLDILNQLLASGVYDGNQFDASVSIEAAEAFKQEFFQHSNAAVFAYNALSGEAQRTTGGRALVKEIGERQNDARRLNGAVSNHRVAVQRAQSEQRKAERARAEAARATMKPQCDALRAQVVEPHRSLSQVMFAVANAATASGWETAHQAPLFQQLSPSMAESMIAITKTCDAPEHKPVMQSGEFCDARPNTDPVAWCRVAAAYQQSKRMAAEQEAAKLAAIPPACATFADDVMSRRNKRRMNLLVNDPKADNLQLEDISKLLKTTTRVARKCAEPQYAEILKTSCSDNPLEDAKTWCELATNARDIFTARLTRPMPNWEIIAEERYDNEDELDERDGWVSVEGPTSFEHTLSFERMMYVNLADFPPAKQKNLFAELGIEAEDFDHYENVLEMIEELQESIEDGAEDWPALPRGQADADAEYGPPLASKLITEQWHEDAEIIDAWYGRGSWKIHKNNLGVIQRRTLPGYVMFKLADDPLCQVRSFTLTEPYTGSATFQPAKGVRFGYVRFQDCDLR